MSSSEAPPPHDATPAAPSVTRAAKQEGVREELARVMAQMSAGEPLPAERDLARQLGIARMTLRRVVDTLVAEGRLIRRQGAGTFLAPPRLDQRLSATSFSDDMRSRGMVPGATTLSARQIPAGMMLASVLGVQPTSSVLHVRRLRTADGQPMAVEDLHVPLGLTPGLAGNDLENSSFYHVLQDRFDLQIASGTQTVAPCLVTDEDAACLEVTAGSPAFLFERTSSVTDGRVVEFVRSVYRGDLYRLVVDIFPGAPATAGPASYPRSAPEAPSTVLTTQKEENS